jgi:hypothetical protein
VRRRAGCAARYQERTYSHRMRISISLLVIRLIRCRRIFCAYGRCGIVKRRRWGRPLRITSFGAEMSWRFRLNKGTAANPRREGRYRLRGFSVGCCGRTGQLCDALEGGAACNCFVVDSCHLRTGDHPGGSCGCRRGEALGVIDVADRFHRPLHHRQREHGAAPPLGGGRWAP